jgi:hypothetical protein
MYVHTTRLTHPPTSPHTSSSLRQGLFCMLHTRPPANPRPSLPYAVTASAGFFQPLLDAHNTFRAAHRAPALVYDSQLETAARGGARCNYEANTFSSALGVNEFRFSSANGLEVRAPATHRCCFGHACLHGSPPPPSTGTSSSGTSTSNSHKGIFLSLGLAKKLMRTLVQLGASMTASTFKPAAVPTHTILPAATHHLNKPPTCACSPSCR